MEKTTLYLPLELQQGLRDLSRRTGRPQAALIREALAEYVAGQEHPWPRSIGTASSGTVTGAGSEAWLREEWSKADAKPLRRTARP
jgi:hypothetical protein